MPMNGYSVGRDISIDLIDPVHGVLRFKVRTGFSKKQETNDIKVKRADGIVDHLVLPDGWTGTLDYERQDATLDNYIADREADYYAGIDNPTISITENITNPGGSLSQFQFTRVVLKYDDAGNAAGDSTVKQKVLWMASRRLRII